ncbi:MAG: type II secretion system protein [Phycisphaerae bacterium]|nr:type II secretion system protein [Phycisphaerae bacterium]MDD5381513.1 type II secretion system protein [Phycisphaerae bacterium]
MKCRSKQILLPAFSLVEVVTALIILALISSSVLVVINRCMASAADSSLRMQAFEVARDNMETLLSKDAVEETVEYGSSDKYPEIKWQTAVEMFYEPAVMGQEQLWVRGICSAEYTDVEGEAQTIELTHWLTSLTKEQLLEMLKQKISGLSELNEPNDISEPNEPFDPNLLKAELNESLSESDVDCDTLPFCESVRCLMKAATPGRPTTEEIIRYLKECP